MTSPSETDFKQHSESVTRRFLQTVVVVDDRAYLELPDPLSKPTAPLKSPARPSFTGAATALEQETSNIEEQLSDEPSLDTPESVVERATTPEETSEDRAHVLDAKYLMESFAKQGMVCAVINPKDFEVAELDQKVYPVAERSDIIMFDWVLHEDTEGKKVTELIVGMTRKAIQQHRLRLIVVYTGELGLFRIADNIEAALKKAAVTNVLRKDNFTLISGPVRIVIYAKYNVSGTSLSDELKRRLVPAGQLPDRLIREFTEMTEGLVSNVALDSLAALRSNTHRILSKFNPDTDAPFLSHRAMLPRPEEAGNLLIHLIGTELTAVLEGNEVGKIADESEGVDVIKAWIDMKEADGYEFAKRFGVKDSPDALTELNKLLRKGVEDTTLKGAFKNFKGNPQKRGITEKLCSASKSASDLEHQFAVLTTLKPQYRSDLNPPSLFPGTLLKEIQSSRETEISSRYWVCIQPICDCVRLEELRLFPLLELKVITDQSKKFELVLPDSKSFVHVNVVYRPYKSRMEGFEPSSDGSMMIRGELRTNEFYFTAENGTKYKWIGELRFEQAQRIVNKYAAELSRVGLDESEWLRRWAL